MANRYWRSTQSSGAVQYVVTHAHLASIGVKSEDSILLKKNVICSHCVFKEVYAGSMHRNSWTVVSSEGCGLRTLCYLEAGNICVALL